MLLSKTAVMPRADGAVLSNYSYLDRLSAGLLRQKPTGSTGIKKSILLLKSSVVFGLLTVAAVIGFIAFDVVRDSERKQFTQAYKTVIDEIIPSTNIGIDDTVSALDNMVSILGDIFPNATAWPNVAYPGFTKMATTAAALTGAAAFVFTPLVLPSQVASFEDFAYDYYAQHPELYPPDVARSEFGRGIYSYGPTNWTDFRYHDTTGETAWGSPKKYLAPALQLVEPALSQEEQNGALMINTRFNDVLCGNAQDRIIDCAAARTQPNQTCAMLTGLNALQSTADPYPRAYVIQPIFAADGAPQKVVGFAAAIILFNNLLLSHIPSETNGIEYVITVNNVVLTYCILGGKPVFKGIGDLHDRAYNRHVRSVDIVQELSAVEHCDEMVYVIDFYPTDTFAHSFRTSLRWVFCIGSVIIIMMVSIIFMCYDFAMVRENNEQQVVLDTKRQFVRFISHEVRTPLNAVSMASDLLRDQLRELAGKITTAEKTFSSSGNASWNIALVDSIELCDDIVSNTNNAVEVLNDLLNYDKIEVGGLSLELSYVAIEDVVESVLKPFKNPAKQKGVEIVLDVSQYMRSVVFPCCVHDDKYCALRVVGDKIRLEQVIRNLVSNALKFCAPNGQITIVVTWEEEGLEAPHALPSQLDKFLHQARQAFPGGRGNRSASGLGVNDRAVSLATLGSVRSSGGDTVRLDQRSVRVRPGLEDSTSMTVRMSSVPGTSTASSARELTPAPSRRAVMPAARYHRSASEFYSSCRRGSVRVSVTDDGAGLTVEQQREFSSTAVNFDAKELQAAQGSGLGLVIAKGIVQQHGGVLTVESKGPQQGSTFTVEIPVFSCDLFTPEENDALRVDGPWEERVKTYRSFGAPVSRDGLGAGVGEAARDRGVRLEAEASAAAAHSDHSAPAATYETTTPADGSSGGHSPVERPAATQPTMATELASEPQRKPLLRRVLLVDDVASNLKMAARILQRSGVVECAKAEDGQIAVDAYVAARALAQQEADLALRQQRAEEGGEQGNDVSAQEPVEPFDAILMDFEMPVMNGPTATAKLRALGCTAPIIGITGNVLPADVEFFLQSGANAVLPKPLRLPDLYDALQR